MADPTQIAVVGSGGVGKTAIVYRFVADKFTDEYEPTIENSYSTMMNYEGAEYTLEITDTSGREEYAQMRDASLRRADGFLVVYSVDSIVSFDELDFHLSAITKAQETDKYPMVLVGNKAEFDESKYQAKEGVTEKKAIALGCPWVEVSAKKNDHIDNCFFLLMQQIYHPTNFHRKKKKKKKEDKEEKKPKGKKEKKRGRCIIQ